VQTIFTEAPTVQDRVADLMTLSEELCGSLDVNDQMTLKQSVKHVADRLKLVGEAADEREKELVNSVAGWNAFQVCVKCSVFYINCI